MYIVKNALSNLLRNKGRNILVAAIIFAIVASTVVALIINNTAAAEIERYKESLSSQVHFTPNSEKMQALMEQQQQEQQEQQAQEYDDRAGQIAQLAGQVSDMSAQMQELEEQLLELEDAAEAPEEQLLRLENQMMQLQTEINALQDEMSQLQGLQDEYEQMQQMGGRGFFRVSGGMTGIPAESLLKFAESDALSESDGYHINGFLGADSEQITAIDQSDDADDGFNQGYQSSGGGNVAFATRIGCGNYRLYGGLWEDFGETNGSRELLDDGVSAFPEKDDECVISQDLAESNGIKVGDEITFTAQMRIDIPSDLDLTDYADGDTIVINGTAYTLSEMGGGRGMGGMAAGTFFTASREVEITLAVTGIYADYNSEYADEGMADMGAASMNRRNEILMTLDSLLALRAKDETNIQLSATYYLKNPDRLDDFASFAYANGLDDLYDVTTDSESFERVVKPVEATKSFSLLIMIIVLVLGGIILVLLTSIAIRERKYEIGVLRAMGMKKKKVALGLWTELLVITCACLVVGVTVGAVLAQPAATLMIEQNQSQADEEAEVGPGGMRGVPGAQMAAVRSVSGGVSFLGGNDSNVSAADRMDVMISFATVLEIIGIALLLSTLAGLLSLTKITKYEPIKILMERN